MWSLEDEMDDDGTDEDEASEDLIAAQALDALLDVDGDGELAQASREALAAITDSAMALKASREAREQREVLEQGAERARQEARAQQEAQAQREAERDRQEAREYAEQQAQAQRQERARIEDEARRITRERERLRAEQARMEPLRREEKARNETRNRARVRVHADQEWRDAARHEEATRKPVQERDRVRHRTERGQQGVPGRERGVYVSDSERARARAEQEWLEAGHRIEKVRKVAEAHARDRAVQEQRKAARRPVDSRHKATKRRKMGGQRPDSKAPRTERPAVPAFQSSRPTQVAPSNPPQRPAIPHPELQQVATDLRDADASATTDLLKRPVSAEPPAPRPAHSGKQPVLTGDDLARWRSRLGLTQQAAASHLGVGQGTISKSEGRSGAALGPTLLRALAAALAHERRTA